MDMYPGLLFFINNTRLITGTDARRYRSYRCLFSAKEKQLGAYHLDNPCRMT